MQISRISEKKKASKYALPCHQSILIFDKIASTSTLKISYNNYVI